MRHRGTLHTKMKLCTQKLNAIWELDLHTKMKNTIIDKIEDLLIRRVSVFSNLDEDEQIFYIEGITSDINNYSKIINSIELFNSELYDNYKKNLDELLNNIVE